MIKSAECLADGPVKNAALRMAASCAAFADSQECVTSKENSLDLLLSRRLNLFKIAHRDLKPLIDKVGRIIDTELETKQKDLKRKNNLLEQQQCLDAIVYNKAQVALAEADVAAMELSFETSKYHVESAIQDVQPTPEVLTLNLTLTLIGRKLLTSRPTYTISEA